MDCAVQRRLALSEGATKENIKLILLGAGSDHVIIEHAIENCLSRVFGREIEESVVVAMKVWDEVSWGFSILAGSNDL
jgi:hypothetical protein